MRAFTSQNSRARCYGSTLVRTQSRKDIIALESIEDVYQDFALDGVLEWVAGEIKFVLFGWRRLLIEMYKILKGLHRIDRDSSHY